MDSNEDNPTIIVSAKSLQTKDTQPQILATKESLKDDKNVLDISEGDTNAPELSQNDMVTQSSETAKSRISSQNSVSTPKLKIKSKGIECGIREQSLNATEEGIDYRYKLDNLLGKGGTGVVHAALDKNLNREVAIKQLNPTKQQKAADIDSFIQEGQIVATLEHPAIIPVYDLKKDESGKLYMTMQKVTGKSLKAYTKRTENRLGINNGINIFIKICDALSLAHSKEVYHQDIKPENIMLGEFGEVYLIDWGASINDDDELAMTPQYMSPEQAGGFDADERSDIFNLGATMYHLLYNKHVNNCNDMNELFNLRSNGKFPDQLSSEDLSHVPQQLRAIILKAIAFDPEERYQKVEELRDDLENFQAGLSVSAYKDTLFEFIKRWIIRYKQQIVTVSLVLLVAMVLGTYIYQQKLKEIAYWGAPIFTDNFEAAEIDKNWVAHKGSFLIKDGRLVTGEGDSFFNIYKHRLSNSCAIEFEGEVLPGSTPCDISAVWCEQLEFNEEQTQVTTFRGPYFIQNGAYENSSSIIFRNGQRLAYNPFKLEVGRKYKIRAEIDIDTIRLFVDGNKLCEYKSLFPFTSGYIGLYGYFSDKAFDNVKIYSKGVAEKIPATATGDYAYEKEHYKDAMNLYSEVARSHKGKPIAEVSKYKQGLCVLKLKGINNEAYKEAQAIWDSITDKELLFLTEVNKLNILHQNKQIDQLIKSMTKLYKSSTPNQQLELKNTWNRLISKSVYYLQIPIIKSLLKVKNELFDNDKTLDFACAGALISLGRYQKVLDKYPDEQWQCALALVFLGKAKEVLTNKKFNTKAARSLAASFLGDVKTSHNLERFGLDLVKSYFSQGIPQRIFIDFPNAAESHASTHLLLGNYQTVITNYPDSEGSIREALVATAQFGKLKELLKAEPTVLINYLILAGKYNEAQTIPDFNYEFAPNDRVLTMLGDTKLAQKLTPNNQLILIPLSYLDIYRRKWDSGADISEELERLNQKLPDYHYDSLEFPRYTLPAMMSLYEGKKEQSTQFLKQIMSSMEEKYEQRLWHNAAYILGEISDDLFTVQPQQHQLNARLTLAKAMRSEFNDDKPNALKFYREYQAIPQYQKSAEAIINEFVQWRINSLL